MTRTIGSIFSGIGGLEYGLKLAGVGRTVWQVEQSAFCRQVLAKHWPDAKRHDDIRTASAALFGPADVICGGFPCQDISAAGRGDGLVDGTRSSLWFDMLRVVSEVRPRVVVVENVAALLSRGFPIVLSGLAELGYDRCEWSVLRASDVGAPHQRARLFVLAYADGLRQPQPQGRQRHQRRRVGHRGAVANPDSERRHIGRNDKAAREIFAAAEGRRQDRRGAEVANADRERQPTGQHQDAFERPVDAAAGHDPARRHGAAQPGVGRDVDGVSAEPERPRVTRDNGSGFTGAHQRRQFTARFRRAVDRTKCTRGALADAAGVSKTMVAVWYGGTSAPLRDRLPALAEALGCSAAWLALETDEPGWRKGTVGL